MKEPPSSTLTSAPWTFRPLGGIVRVLAYMGVLVLFFVMLGATMDALILPFVMFSEPASPLKTIGMVIFWLAIVALAFASARGFASLNRRLDMSRYVKRCAGGSIYVLGGSVFRGFSGIGSFGFDPGAMILRGRLGPNLFWPLLIIIAIDILSGLVILSGGQGIVIGGLGAIIILAIYNSVLKREASITVEPPSIASVRCRGPIVTMTFKPKPVPFLGAVTIFVPPDQGGRFFRKFNDLFPEKLPSAYREALSQN